MIKVCLGVLLLMIGSAVSRGAEPAIAFSDHPRMPPATRPANEIAAIRAKGDELLKRELSVPTKGGQWPFYYACPKDGAWLKAESPEKHVCPTCKTVYSDERTVAAYRTILNDQLNQQCLDLASAYNATSDEKYVVPVRKALLEVAKIYPTLERHDRWGRTGVLAVVGGRRYCQLLEESIGAIKLAEAYDLVANAKCLSADDRKVIEQEFLGATAREVQKFSGFAGGQNNHQTWFNAAYTVVGIAIGDVDLVNEGIRGGHGLTWQLQNSVTLDGLWYEGSIAYHFYALAAIEKTLDAVRHVGMNFADADNEQLKKLWLGPTRMAYPNGQLPVFHDSDPANLKGYTGFYKWAADYFNDPKLLDAGNLGQLKSEDLTGIGVAALRRGSGDKAVCAMIEYGQHGGSHGHPDKLNIVLYALGHEFVLDPGRISYSVPEYKSWCRTTAAHNTVVIDERDQEPTTGELWWFADTAKYSAAFCASKGAYPGYLLRRCLILNDTTLIDVLTVSNLSGKGDAQFDWFMHCRGTPRTALTFEPLKDLLGKQNGYQHLSALSQSDAKDEAAKFSFEQGGKTLGVHLAGDPADKLYQGIGIGYTLTDKVPFVMRRHTGSEAVFVAVYDLSGDGSAVKSVDVSGLNGNKAPAADSARVKVNESWVDIDFRLTVAPENSGRIVFEDDSKKK